MAAIIGHGTTLKYATATNETSATNFTAVSNVFSVNMPDTDVDEVEVTHYGSTGNWKEFIAGLEDGGEIEAEMNHDETQLNTLAGLRRINQTWRITLPDSSYWSFAGYIKKIGGTIPDQDKVTVRIIIRITGAPTWTTA